MGEETFEQMFRAKVIKPGETVLCVRPQLMADYLFHSISTYNLQCQPLHLSISIF